MTTVSRITPRFKMVLPEFKVLDAEAGRVHAIVSTEAVDRDGDIIRASGWMLANFLKHPVLISSHDYRLQSVIGEWESMEVKGKRLEGIARYYIGEGNEEADWGFNLAGKGRAAYSVGFIPDQDKAMPRDPDKPYRGMEYKGQELLEVSHVAIPSNPQALQRLKSWLGNDKGFDPLLLELVDREIAESIAVLLGDKPAPHQSLDYRALLTEAFQSAYEEVAPW